MDDHTAAEERQAVDRREVDPVNNLLSAHVPDTCDTKITYIGLILLLLRRLAVLALLLRITGRTARRGLLEALGLSSGHFACELLLRVIRIIVSHQIN